MNYSFPSAVTWGGYGQSVDKNDSEARLRTWVEGYGHFGRGPHSNVHLSRNFAGRFQESADSASTYEVAEDYMRYLKLKGYAEITAGRFNLLLKSGGWSRYFDPFISNLKPPSIVFRGSLDDAWEVRHRNNSESWELHKFEFNADGKFEGWRIAIPFLYKEFLENRFKGDAQDQEKIVYAKNWLSCGLNNLKSEIRWMYFFDGPIERDEWLTEFGGFDAAFPWLTVGRSATESKQLSDAGFTPHQIMASDFAEKIKNFQTPNPLLPWIKSGLSGGDIRMFMLQDISVDVATQWMDTFPMESVQQWVENGFKSPEDVTGWISNEFEPTSASAWKYFGFPSPDEAAAWRNVVSKPELAQTLKSGGYQLHVADPNESGTQCVMHSESGTILTRKDLKSLEQLSRATVEGIIRDVLEVGFAITDVIRWRSHGFDSSEYPSWIAVHINPQTAARYKNFGFGPTQAATLIRDNIPPSHAIRQGISPTGH